MEPTRDTEGLLSPSAQGGACSQGRWAEDVLSGHGYSCGVPGSQTMSKGTQGPRAEICIHSTQDH